MKDNGAATGSEAHSRGRDSGNPKLPPTLAEPPSGIGPGSVVRLRCGGPLMVVSRYEERPRHLGAEILGMNSFAEGWLVHWTVQNALRTATLSEAVLELVPDK